jgi:transposase
MVRVIERCMAGGLDAVPVARRLDEITRLKFNKVNAQLSDGHLAMVGVLPDHKQETVKVFLENIPPKVRSTIRSVCSDLYEG